MSSAQPSIPVVELPRVSVPAYTFFDHGVYAHLSTDPVTIKSWIDYFRSQPPAYLAADIETDGLDEDRFVIKCVTISFKLGEDTVAFLLDPLRAPEHRKLITAAFDHASRIVFHGGTFDIAPLYAHRIMTREHIMKVGDTLVAARMLNTWNRGGRNLEDLSTAYRVMNNDRITMDRVFTARGLVAKRGWHGTDIDTPTYQIGAMSDTVATLRLYGEPGVGGNGILAHAATVLSGGTYGVGVLTTAQAGQLVEDQQQVNRIILARTARGYAVDDLFPEKWAAQTRDKVREAAALLAANRVRPGNGADLIRLLHTTGELPPNWPRTDKGALKSDKAAMKILEDLADEDEEAVIDAANINGSTLAKAHSTIARAEKVRKYVEKVVRLSGPTGRLHPEIKVLGACASGRMAASDPEIQQFPEQARGVIVADDGSSDWVSCDWKSIEPVVMATAAGDQDFINAMKAGQDPYEPIGEAAGVTRKKAKVIMLANMYGQGLKSMAVQNGMSEDRAKEVLDALRNGLPVMYSLIDRLRQRSKETNYVTTLSGRVLYQLGNEKLTPEQRAAGYKSQIVPKPHVAANHFCQGSALDTMHHSVLELEKRGLSDKIHLWVHDELVGDVDIRDEIIDVMSTPPPFLADAAEAVGVDPFLAVDDNEMGRQWMSV